jgi:hypothetical protein
MRCLHETGCILSLVLALSTPLGCSKKVETGGAEEAHVDSLIALPASAARSGQIASEVCELRSLADTLAVTGEIQPDPLRVAHISTRVSGTVQSVRTVIGNRVRRGEPLAALYSPEFLAAQTDFLLAHQRVDRAKTAGNQDVAALESIANSSRRRLEVLGCNDSDLVTIQEKHEPVPYLVELGVQAADGRVRAPRRAKFRQVNRFVELVDDVVPSLPDGDLRVVDFGSGRAYLTFALHDLLTRVHGRRVELLGLDLKPNVVAECEALARRLGAEGLRFELGDIADADLEGVDLVVSLHACDTAADVALERAVRAGAKVILAVPCCQHELLGQLSNDTLRPLLRHGTLRERLVAEVTDAARARLLELAGYEVQVVEFVPLEHTPKNVLLRARRTKRPAHDRARLAQEYRVFADALAIEPALERLLRDVVELPA